MQGDSWFNQPLDTSQGLSGSIRVNEFFSGCGNLRRKVLTVLPCCISIRSVPKGIERIGDYSEEGTPVPIPNTEVKLFCSDDTVRAALWENRTLPLHPPHMDGFFVCRLVPARDYLPPRQGSTTLHGGLVDVPGTRKGHHYIAWRAFTNMSISSSVL